MAALAGILASLAILTRYAGIALLIAGPVIIYLDPTSSRRDRLLRGGIFALAALSLPLLRSAYLGLVYGVMLPRTGATTSVGWDTLAGFRGDVTQALWQLLPFTASLPRLTYRQMLGGLGILVLAFVVLMVVADRVGSRLTGASTREGGRRWIGAGVFVIAYVATLGLSYALTSPTPDINYRILSPAQVPVWILLPIPLLALTRQGSRARWIAPAALLAVAAVGAPQTLELARETRAHGGGLMTPAWRNSETVEYVIRARPGAVISNETAALQLWASRPAYDLPDVLAPVDAIEVRYGDALNDPVQGSFREGSAALVLFDSIRGQLIGIYGDDADRRYEALVRDLEVVADLSDGTVYAYPR